MTAITTAGATSNVVISMPIGAGIATFDIVFGPVDDPTVVDPLPTPFTVIVQGAGALEDVTIDVDGTDIAVLTSDAFGDIGPIDVTLGEALATGAHTITATSPSRGVDSFSITIVNGAVGGTADPGVDASPVLVDDSVGRWVLQDLMPGGLGSWVMPVNPKSMSNPHLTKTVQTQHTTAPTTGRYHVGQANLTVVPWTLSGYCPDAEFEQQLEAYSELNRRIYVIDHRGRAWKCAVTLLEITPRKRQLNTDGTPQDWASDYRLVLDLLDQTFLTPA